VVQITQIFGGLFLLLIGLVMQQRPEIGTIAEVSAFLRRQINQIYTVIQVHALDAPLYLSGKIWGESVISVFTVHPDNTDISSKFTRNIGHATSEVLKPTVTPDLPFGGSISLGFQE